MNEDAHPDGPEQAVSEAANNSLERLPPVVALVIIAIWIAASLALAFILIPNMRGMVNE